MSFDKPIRRIAVVATDPAPNAEAALGKYVDEAWEQLKVIGLSSGAARDRLSFTTNMKEALARADFVQENGPERPDFKIKLYADMDEATPPDSIIASSSSGLTMSVIQSKCRRPERCVIGHPFNPPHIIPLVEVVGGTKTSPAAIEQAMAF
jgi:3-hydroxyacyl-CoA dehydrogenase